MYIGHDSRLNIYFLFIVINLHQFNILIHFYKPEIINACSKTQNILFLTIIYDWLISKLKIINDIQLVINIYLQSNDHIVKDRSNDIFFCINVYNESSTKMEHFAPRSNVITVILTSVHRSRWIIVCIYGPP